MKWLAALVCAGCLRVPHARVGSGDGGPSTGDGASGGQNHVFVSAGAYTMGWNRTNADYFCGGQAMEARLPGNFVAWLSFQGSDAIDYVSGMPFAQGWHLTDTGNELFARTPADILALPHAVAVRYDQFGNDLVATLPGVEAATGTTHTGVADGPTSADCFQNAIEIGYAAAVDGTWTEAGENSCGATSLHLYCFGFGGTTP